MSFLICWIVVCMSWMAVDAFTKNVVIMSAGCGQSFSSSWGNFTYPETFPFRPYWPGLRCRWRINVPNPDSRIEVTLPYVVMRLTDYVVIMDGSVGPVPLKPCNRQFYSDHTAMLPIHHPDLDGSRTHPPDRIFAFRGAQAGMDAKEIVFQSLSSSVIIDFCPSRFPIAAAPGLGLIVLWEEIAFVPSPIAEDHLSNFPFGVAGGGFVENDIQSRHFVNPLVDF